MRISVLKAASLAIWLAAPATGQSTLTLDDFDLGDDPDQTERVGHGDIERCLLDPDSCPTRAGIDFTIDDVVNLGIVDREEVVVEPVADDGGTPPPATALPSVDLEVLFDTNSDAIRPDQMTQLFDLAAVLRENDFSQYLLVFMGHTDAKGSATYNEDLSHRRARSVADFIAASANVPPERIEAVGLGFQRLADPADPFSEKNRRVQLVLVPRG